MPIRTDRGRAAALRQFWSWPLRSGRHMLVTVLVAAAVITGIAVAANAVGSAETQPTSMHRSTPPAPSPHPETPASTPGSPTPSSAATETTTSTATSTPTPVENTTAVGRVSAGDAGAVATATGFVTHWLRPPEGTSTQAWMRPLLPYVMPGVVVNLETIAPANIPATAVTGKASVVSNKEGVAKVDVPTDAGVIRVTVIASPDGQWLVRRWAPVGR